MKTFITSSLLLLLMSSNAFPQCIKNISTNPMSPQNDEFLQLANTWYGGNGPYTVNSMLNTWSWYPPSNTPNFDLTLTNGWASDLPTTLTLTMNNPFYGAGSPTFIHAQATNYENRDWKWEDGWELLWMNLGRYPDMTLSTALTPGSYWGENSLVHSPDPDNVPYFVLYNRYRGTVRVFANPWKTNLVPNSQEFMVQWAFDELALSSGLSGILRHAGTYDLALDKATIFNKHYSPRQSPTNKVNWMVTDFQAGFDPCICLKEEDADNPIGKLQFLFSDISTTSIEMTSRSISIDEEITEAGLLDDFLNMSEINTGNYEPGQRIYTKMEDAYEDYRKRLEKYRTELDEQKGDFPFLNAFLSKVAPALTNDLLEWSTDEVVSKLKEDPVMAQETDEAVADEIARARERYEPDFNGSQSLATSTLKNLTKGILGVGFDFLSAQIFEKSSSPVQPTAPVATYTETVYKGNIIHDNITPGAQLYQPGGMTYGNANDGYWGYGKADLAFSAMPAYNKVLGLYALLKTPGPLFNFQATSSTLITDPVTEQPEFDDDGCLQEEKWTSESKTNLRFDEPLLIALNNSIDIDLNRTNTYVQIELILSTDIPAELEQVNMEYSPIFEGNLGLDTEAKKVDSRFYTFVSKWVKFSDLNQYDFSLNTEFVFDIWQTMDMNGPLYCIPAPLVTPNFSPTGMEMKLQSVRMKVMNDFYFDQIGSNGQQVNTTQILNYELYNSAKGINELGSASDWEDNEGIFDEYIPGTIEISDLVIFPSHPFVHEVIGNDIYINAENIDIIGNGPLQPLTGYNVIFQALNSINVAPSRWINPGIHMCIKKDFYDTPVFEYADNATVYNFCNNSNAYQANTASKSLRERIIAEQEQAALEEAPSDVEANNKVALYPNPANGAIQLRSSDLGISRVDVYDIAGRLMLQRNYGAGGGKEVQMEIQSLQTGVYFVHINCGGQIHKEKLVVGR